jgi:3-hydroxyisobutyrate dehydrogenase
VSGGVKRAVDGTLAIMAGGAPDDVTRARPLLERMGTSVFATGAIGSGHACKALNNYVSAAGLAAACEAVLVAERFGVDPAILVDVLNASTGRNNSTELATALGVSADGLAQSAALWAEASATLGRDADHTEIHRYLAARPRPTAEE